MATKVRIQSATDEELVDKCKEETDCGDCDPVGWTTPARNVRINPPKNTVALVVDVRGGQGAIRIVNKEDNKHVDDVGPIKEGGNLVIIPWKNIWWYYAIGSVRVAHVEKSLE